MPADPRAAARPLAVLVGLTATVVFLLYFLAARNIDDDEVGSLALVLLPLPELRDLANNWDLHPPGMYALTRVTHLLVGSASGCEPSYSPRAAPAYSHCARIPRGSCCRSSKSAH